MVLEVNMHTWQGAIRQGTERNNGTAQPKRKGMLKLKESVLRECSSMLASCARAGGNSGGAGCGVRANRECLDEQI